MRKEDFFVPMDAEWQTNGKWIVGNLSPQYDLNIVEGLGCGPSGRLDHGYYLYHYASLLPNNSRIVEIGTGGSTICMGMGIRGKDSIILTIDPGTMSTEEIQNRKHELDEYDVLQITLDQIMKFVRVAKLEGYIVPIPDTSENVLKRWDGKHIDMLFVDGSHQYKDVKMDCQWMQYVRKGGVAVFDDWIEPVERAVMEYVAPRPEWELLTSSANQQPKRPWKTVFWRN